MKTGTTPYNQKYVITPITGITAPKGHYLRENGKKIFPGHHTAPDGVTVNNTYYVGVYDDSTFIRGYINPNSKVFLPLNTDKPVTIEDDLATDAKDGNIAQGPPVRTTGYVASGVIAVTDVDGGTSNRNGFVDATLGNTFTFYPSAISSDDKYLFVYFGSAVGTAIAPPSGSIITLVFRGLTNYFYKARLNQGTDASLITYVRGDLYVYKNTYATITLISDGVGLREISRTTGDANDDTVSAKALQIVAYGNDTTNGSGTVTVSSAYALNINKIIIQNTSSSRSESLRVSGISAGSSFTVTASGSAAVTFSWFILG